jgi:hypothetical protein
MKMFRENFSKVSSPSSQQRWFLSLDKHYKKSNHHPVYKLSSFLLCFLSYHRVVVVIVVVGYSNFGFLICCSASSARWRKTFLPILRALFERDIIYMKNKYDTQKEHKAFQESCYFVLIYIFSLRLNSSSLPLTVCLKGCCLE